jgi:hypothetical protein
MAGLGLATRLPAQPDRNASLFWIGSIWVLALVGFGADFARYFHESPSPPPILYVHGAVCVAWLGLVTTQVWLAETGRIPLHRTLGWVTIAMATVVVPFGFVAAMVDMARQVGHADYAPQFLGEEFQDILAFAICTSAGVATRRVRSEHSRWMILAAVALMDVGPGRIATNLVAIPPKGPVEVWLTYYWGTDLLLLAMLTWDLVQHRRVSRAVALGGMLLIGGEALVSWLYFAPAWQHASGALVTAWGWAG